MVLTNHPMLPSWIQLHKVITASADPVAEIEGGWGNALGKQALLSLVFVI